MRTGCFPGLSAAANPEARQRLTVARAIVRFNMIPQFASLDLKNCRYLYSGRGVSSVPARRLLLRRRKAIDFARCAGQAPNDLVAVHRQLARNDVCALIIGDSDLVTRNSA